MTDVTDTNVNDLVALHALLDEQSVTRAALRIGVTQSSMSGTLARLRELYADPLLIRVGRGMQPTPLAEAVAPALRAGIEAFNAALTGPPGFDPTTSQDHFVLAMNDFAELVLLPSLIRRASASAPGVSLQVVPWGRFEPPPGLAMGGVDVMVGFLDGSPGAGHVTAKLFETRFRTIARRGHPRLADGLSLDAYIAERHIIVTESLRAGGVVDEALEVKGLRRRIGARVPHFTVVPFLVEATDHLATVDEGIADYAAQRAAVQIFAPPLELPRNQIELVWHARTEADPARRWLRELIQAMT